MPDRIISLYTTTTHWEIEFCILSAKMFNFTIYIENKKQKNNCMHIKDIPMYIIFGDLCHHKTRDVELYASSLHTKSVRDLIRCFWLTNMENLVTSLANSAPPSTEKCSKKENSYIPLQPIQPLLPLSVDLKYMSWVASQLAGFFVCFFLVIWVIVVWAGLSVFCDFLFLCCLPDCAAYQSLTTEVCI